MHDINKLKILCKKLSIPFCYQVYDKKYYLHFGIEERNLRFLSSLWNYYGLCFSNVLFQYYHLGDKEMIRVICEEKELSSILQFFLHPVYFLDTSFFSYFQTILSKFQEEGVSATFLNGCKGYPYFLKLESYDRSFKANYLRCIWNKRIYNQNSCFGFSSTEALKHYVYEVYSVKHKKNPMDQLIRSFIKKS